MCLMVTLKCLWFKHSSLNSYTIHTIGIVMHTTALPCNKQAVLLVRKSEWKGERSEDSNPNPRYSIDKLHSLPDLAPPNLFYKGVHTAQCGKQAVVIKRQGSAGFNTLQWGESFRSNSSFSAPSIDSVWGRAVTGVTVTYMTQSGLDDTVPLK